MLRLKIYRSSKSTYKFYFISNNSTNAIYLDQIRLTSINTHEKQTKYSAVLNKYLDCIQYAFFLFETFFLFLNSKMRHLFYIILVIATCNFVLSCKYKVYDYRLNSVKNSKTFLAVNYQYPNGPSYIIYRSKVKVVRIEI